MKFWDSSALVPLCVTEPRTPRAEALYNQDPEMAVWWGSTVECASAFARLGREGQLEDDIAARSALSAIEETWHEVHPSTKLRTRAIRLIRLHPLRAADALQLAAALDWAGVPSANELVTFDTQLEIAALREGFTVP